MQKKQATGYRRNKHRTRGCGCGEILAVEILDLLGAAGVAQLADCLVFNLTDTLTGNTKVLTHFFQGVGTAVIHTKTHAQHICLTLGQGVQDLLQCFCQQCVGAYIL